jgi:hypothetical protein
MKPAYLILVAVLALGGAAPGAADTAGGPPEGLLRIYAAFSGASALDAWNDAAPDNYQFLGFGFSAEYGVLPWASLAVQWQPGVLLSAYSFRGPSGSLSDIRGFFRFGLLGEQALIKQDGLRLALLAGAAVPLPSLPDTGWEPGIRLWGALAGFSFDYLPLPLFQVNLSTTACYYPKQISGNPAFSRQSVDHPLDLRIELEPRFNFLLPRGIVLTLPAVYEFSPRSHVRGQALEDERHGLSLGLGYTIAIQDVSLPFEVGMKFLAPLYGVSGSRVQRIELTGKIDIPVGVR